MQGSGRNKLAHEDVVVDTVTYTATNHSDGQGKGGYGCNQVVGAYDCGYDRSRYYDSPNSQSGDDEESPQC